MCWSVCVLCVCVGTECLPNYINPHIVHESSSFSHSYMNILNPFVKSWNHQWGWKSGRMGQTISLWGHCACCELLTPFSPTPVPPHCLPGTGFTMDQDQGCRQLCSLGKTQDENMGLKTRLGYWKISCTSQVLFPFARPIVCQSRDTRPQPSVRAR